MSPRTPSTTDRNAANARDNRNSSENANASAGGTGAAAAPAPSSARAVLERITAAGGDAEAIGTAMREGLAAGAVAQADVAFIERFLADGLGGTPMPRADVEKIAEATRLPIVPVRIVSAVPGFMSGASARGAAFGNTIVTAATDLDNAADARVLAHEYGHVVDFHERGAETAVAFDVGTGPDETRAVAAEEGIAARGAARTPTAPRALTREEEIAMLRRWERDMREIRSAMETGVFDWAVTDGDCENVLRILGRMPPLERIGVLEHLRRTSAVTLNRLSDEIPDSQKIRYSSVYLAVQVIRQDWTTIQAMMRQAPASRGFTDNERGVLGMAIPRMPSASFTTLGRNTATVANTRAWLALAPPDVAASPLTLLRAAAIEAEEAARARTERERETTERRTRADGMMADHDSTFYRNVHEIQQLLTTSFWDWFITDGDVSQVYTIFARMPEERVRDAVVWLEAQEGGQYIRRLIDETPDPMRWQRFARVFVIMLEARRPEDNLALVRNLLSTGFLNGVSDEEARLAFRIVRRMPRDVQDEFREVEDGRLWTRMQSSLSGEDINDRDANLYSNRDESAALQAEYRAHCGEWPPARLRAMTEMLLRQGKVDFVESALTDARVQRTPENIFLRMEFGLGWGGQERHTLIYQRWLGNARAMPNETGFWQRVGEVFRLIGNALEGLMAGVGITSGGEASIDLQAIFEIAPELLSNLTGITLGPRGDNERANRADINYNTTNGRVLATLPQLNIAQYNSMSGGTTVQVGATTVTNVRADVKYPTEADPSAHFILQIDGVEAHDIAQMGQESMATIGLLRLSGLDLRAQRSRNSTVPREMMAALTAVVMEMQDSLGQIMAVADFSETQPERVAASLCGAAGGAMNMTVQLASLHVENVATSNGTFAGSADVSAIRVDTTRVRRSAAAQARLDELTRLESESPLTEAQVAERARLTRERDAFRAREGRLDALISLSRDPNHPHSEAEEEELRRLQDELTVAETEVAVGRIEVADVHAGARSVDALAVSGVRVHSTSQRTGEAGRGDRESTTTVSADSVTARGVHDGGSNRYEALEARVTELRGKMEAGTATDEERTQFETLHAQYSDLRTRVRRLNEIRASSPNGRTADQTTALHTLETELAPWLDRSGGTDIASLSIAGREGGGPGLSATMDTHGHTEATIAHMEAEGVVRAGTRVDHIEADGVRLDAHIDTSRAADQGVMERLASADVSAERLHVRGLALESRLSTSLRTELQALRDQQALRPETMTPVLRERLGALPAELATAERGEARIAELRALTTPLTAEQRAELDALAARFDTTFQRVEEITARNLEAGIRPGSGRLTFAVGEGVAAGESGLSVRGVSMGHRAADGSETVTTSVDSVSATSLGADVDVADGGRIEDIFVARGGRPGERGAEGGEGSARPGYSADFHARGLDVAGYRSGTSSSGGSTSVDRVHVDSIDGHYDSSARTEDGRTVDGRLTTDIRGAEVSGVHMASGSRIARVREEIGTIEAGARATPLTPRQEERLADLRRQVTEYERLVTTSHGRGRAATRARRTLADEWNATSETSVGRVAVSDVSLTADNIGDLTGGMDTSDMSVSGHSDGTIRAEGVESVSHGRRDARTSVEFAEARGTRFSASDMSNPEGGRYGLHMDEVETGRVRAPGTGARRVTGRGIDVGMAGHDATVSAERLGLSGAYSGGNSAGHVGLSGVRASVTGIGTRDQRVAGSAGGVSLSSARSRSEAMDARVRSLRGRRASFSMGRGGMSASVASFSGDGIEVTTHGVREDAAAGICVPSEDRYAVDHVEGRGASLSSRGGTTSVGLAHGEATGVHAEGDSLAGRTLDVRRVTVDGVAATMGPGGTFRVGVDYAGADGVRVTEADGTHGTTVEHAHVRDASVSGDSSGISHAHVGELEVRDVQANYTDMTASVALVTATDLNAEGVNFAAGTVDRASIGTADVEGFSMTSRDAATGAETHVGADRAHVERAVGSVETGGIYRGTVGRARVEGGTISGDRTGAIESVPPGMEAAQEIIGRRDGRVDVAEVTDVAAGYNAQTGEAAGTWSGARVEGVRYDETDTRGASTMHVDTDRLSTGSGMARVDDVNHPERGFRATADDTRLGELNYTDAAAGRSLHAEGGRIGRAYAGTTGDGDIVAGAQDANLDSFSFREGEGRPDAAHIHASGERIEGASGSATIRDGAVVYAGLDEANVGSLDAGYRGGALDPNARPTTTRTARTDLDLSALAHAEGFVTIRYGSGTIRVPVRDGHVTPNDIRVAVGEYETSIRTLAIAGTVASVVAAPTITTELAVLTALGEAPIPVGRATEVITSGVTGVMERMGHESTSDPNAPAVGTWARDVHVDAELTGLGGGRIAVGDTFSTRVDAGAALSVTGSVGTDIRATATDTRLRDVRVAGDAPVEIDEVGAGSLDVRARELATGRPTYDVGARDAEVRGLRYGDRDAAHRDVTTELTSTSSDPGYLAGGSRELVPNTAPETAPVVAPGTGDTRPARGRRRTDRR